MRTLTTEQLAECVQGVLAVEGEEGGLLLRRFGAGAMAYWSATEGWWIRARCPAGVRVAFATDADRLHLDATLGKFSRSAGRFDCYVDGLAVASVGSDDGSPVSEMIVLPGQGVRSVELWLPQMRIVTSLAISLPDGSACRPRPRTGTYLAMGDSITQGMETPFPSLCYPAIAARATGLSLHNTGVGGAVFDADSIPEPPLPHAPDAITVAYGVNDWNRGSSPELAKAFLHRLRDYYPHAPTAVLEPLWYAGGDTDPSRTNPTGQTFADYRRHLRDIVSSLGGLTWVPRERLVPPGPAMLIDGCHPNTAGFAFYGANVAVVLGELLGEGVR